MAMDPAHETAINDLVCDVLDTGVARVERRLLLRWVGGKNWTKKIWGGLNQRFRNELKERGEDKDGWVLYAIDKGEFVSLVCFNPKDIDSWWQPVEVLEFGI